MNTEMHASGCGLHSDYRRPLKRVGNRPLTDDLAEEELKNATTDDDSEVDRGKDASPDS